MIDTERAQALAEKHGATSYRNRADTSNPAFGFTLGQLQALIAEVEQAAPLTDAQINEGRDAVNDDPDYRPEPWAFRKGVKFAERMHGITQERSHGK